MASKKIALVTGGSRGIGRNIAHKLALSGIDVIITYNSRKDAALAVVNELTGFGVKATAIQLSLGKNSSFPDFFKTLSQILNNEFSVERFDYLVNNAGAGLHAPFDQTTETQFDEVMNVQFKGVYFFTQRALSFLNNGSSIVNLSSRLAQAVVPGCSAYAAMKGAIETLTRYQARELAVCQIRVNSVAPGPVATEFGDSVILDPAYQANIIARTALGRVAEPEDIGGVVSFLCSEDARWITAQRIEVSGGIGL
jgi:NAD(P)-dependent dehydrogenase (short-subunit alcohol dehydrogenase family)